MLFLFGYAVDVHVDDNDWAMLDGPETCPDIGVRMFGIESGGFVRSKAQGLPVDGPRPFQAWTEWTDRNKIGSKFQGGFCQGMFGHGLRPKWYYIRRLLRRIHI